MPLIRTVSIVRRLGSLSGTTLASFFLCFMAGCGGSGYPAPVPVFGTITLGGKPMESGMVFFVPDDAKKA
jgi:hypothetical protein